jgi:hypothetical protein
MTLLRALSSSSFYIPRRDSADLCLDIATLRVQVCSALLPATTTLTPMPTHSSPYASSGILGDAVTGKRPFNTQ